MRYYLLVTDEGRSMGVWKIDDAVAIRADVASPQTSTNCYFEAAPGETILETLANKAPVWFGANAEVKKYELRLAPGEYHPRIARPPSTYPHYTPGGNPANNLLRNEIALMRGQLIALMRRLQTICQTVHPTPSTFETFGHEIRNLLILACTEVEAHWRAVLTANKNTAEKLSTNDYVKLCSVMRLSEYEIAFPFYPWLDPIKPFENWGTTGRSTKELPWYSSYNLVKHDRDNHFSKSNLRHAFESVTACAVMMLAQFGREDGFGSDSELQHFFEMVVGPSWSPADAYTPPSGDAKLARVNVLF